FKHLDTVQLEPFISEIEIKEVAQAKKDKVINKSELAQAKKNKVINKSELTITFINPYLKFNKYPKEYSWRNELLWPQSSPFVKTINKEIYKTWNGEALIKF